MRKKILLTIVSILLVCVALAGCNNENPVNESEGNEKKKIKIGANIGNIPWEFMEGDKLVGFEVDLINEISNNLDFEVEFVNTPWNGLFPGLLGGKYDIALSSVTIKPDRVEKMDFTQPYYDSDQSLVVNSKSDYKGLADMKDRIVAVTSGSTADIWAQENNEKLGFKEIRLYDTLQESMLDLLTSRIDGIIGDKPASDYYIKDKPDYITAEIIETGEKYAMVFKKDNPFRDEVNEEISKLKESGKMSEIYKKWFGVEPDRSTTDVLPVPKN